MENKMYIGSVYYPDHWPRERWEEDVRLMKEAGVNALRLADLAWSTLEPVKDEFNFSWLDEFIELVKKVGIKVILMTPTEASPVWLRHEYPDVVAKNKFKTFAAERGYHCHNNTDFIERVAILVEKMAKH